MNSLVERAIHDLNTLKNSIPGKSSFSAYNEFFGDKLPILLRKIDSAKEKILSHKVAGNSGGGSFLISFLMTASDLNLPNS